MPDRCFRQIRRVLIRAAALVALATLLVLSPLGADAGDALTAVPAWSVAELKGTAFIRSAADENEAWRPLRTGASLPPGSVIMTGEGSRLVLDNGVDRVRLSADSQVELPVAPEDGAVTRVIHWVGSVFFHVGKRPPRQFEVDTPYLVAIVKGTKFTTTVAAAGASVKVSEGVVGVSPSTGGDGIDLTAGQAASVSAAAAGKVSPGELSGAADPAANPSSNNSATAGPAGDGRTSQGNASGGDGSHSGGQTSGGVAGDRGQGDSAGGDSSGDGDGDGDGGGDDGGSGDGGHGYGHGCGRKGHCGHGDWHGHGHHGGGPWFGH